MIVRDLGFIFETKTSKRKNHCFLIYCDRCQKHLTKRLGRVDREEMDYCHSCTVTLKNTTHGLYYHPLKGVYNTMKQRCSNKNVRMFYRYGARGITVCKEWKDDFKKFYSWAIANGYKQGLSVDRINNDGNYEPLNCQWITIRENIAKEARLKKKDIDAICREYTSSKITQTELAIKYDVDKSRVGQILKEQGIKCEYRGGIKKKLSKNIVLEILKDNRIAKLIASDYGVHTSTIYSIKQGRY